MPYAAAAIITVHNFGSPPSLAICVYGFIIVCFFFCFFLSSEWSCHILSFEGRGLTSTQPCKHISALSRCTLFSTHEHLEGISAAHFPFHLHAYTCLLAMFHLSHIKVTSSLCPLHTSISLKRSSSLPGLGHISDPKCVTILHMTLEAVKWTIWLFTRPEFLVFCLSRGISNMLSTSIFYIYLYILLYISHC